MFNYLIIVNDNDELKSVKSEDIPAKIARYLESAIELALDVDSAADDLRPSITIGGLTDNDRARLAKLDALEAGGVESWEWYDTALEDAGLAEETPADDLSPADEQEVA